MATSKSKKVRVEACTICSVDIGNKQRAWGVEFEAVLESGKTRLIAELSAEDAANFIEHGQCVKA